MATSLMRLVVSKRRLFCSSLSTTTTTTTTVCRGGRVRKKMPESEIEELRYDDMERKVMAELTAMKFKYDHTSLRVDDRLCTHEFSELKSLFKDLRKYNLRNGVVPPPRDYEQEIMEGPNFGYTPKSWILGKDDPGICEMGRVAVEQYNKDHSSNLEFVSVLEAKMVPHVGNYDILVQARDPSVSRVIRLFAHSYVPYRRLDFVHLHRPRAFAELLRQNEAKESSISRSEIEPLLYANLHNCPIINMRLGLKRRERRDHSPGSLVKVPLDDQTLMNVAESTVNQRPNLQFQRAVGAWREVMVNKSVYYVVFEAIEVGAGKRLYAATLRAAGAWLEKIMDDRSLKQSAVKALEGGVLKRFYAAISVNAEGGDSELVDLVSVDSPRATMK